MNPQIGVLGPQCEAKNVKQYTVKKGVLLCTLSLTHLVCCSLVVMVTFDNLCSIQYNQCLTQQVC